MSCFDLLDARGLSKGEAAAIFIPQMVGATTAILLFGWLTDRVAAVVPTPTT